MTASPRKTVLITGASSGVGVAAARAFAEAGYDVALLARSREGLEVAAEDAREAGARAVVVPADVADREAVRAAVEQTVAELGHLDVLVSNAALAVFGPFEDIAAEDFDRVIEVTFLGAVNVVREALPHLTERDGVIVSVGSVNSRVPLPTWSPYAAAKHALRGFLNTLSVELKAEGSRVRVAQLHPGPINTPLWEQTQSAVGHQPRRPPDGYPPEQVAEALVRLAEDPVPERLFGGEAIGLDKLWAGVRPAGEAVMAAVHHYFLSGGDPDTDDTQALRQAVGKGIKTDGTLQRPSLTAAARGLASLTTGGVRLPRRLLGL
jgi:NAD(P)-dependent dehydrogenase (short-subunit alcohol dehydrogenase family)